jgi:hypothetical protein
MTSKTKSGKKQEHLDTANLGQRDAEQQQERQSELAQMGEHSDQSNKKKDPQSAK